MPKETENYGLKKPLYSDNADIAVINGNFDEIDKLLTPTISDTAEPGSESKAKLSVILGWLANRIKEITGLDSWKDTSLANLEDCIAHIDNGTHDNATKNSSGFMSSADKSKLDNATNAYTGSTVMMRDSLGRAQVQSPSGSNDIVNKTYVDSNFVRKNAATTMSATLTAYSNTAYTTKQVRNIVLWTSGDTPPVTSYGDIVIKTFT